jgi:hypothetical protein
LVEFEPQLGERFTIGHECCLHHWANAALGPVRTQRTWLRTVHISSG